MGGCTGWAWCGDCLCVQAAGPLHQLLSADRRGHSNITSEQFVERVSEDIAVACNCVEGRARTVHRDQLGTRKTVVVAALAVPEAQSAHADVAITIAEIRKALTGCLQRCRE